MLVNRIKIEEVRPLPNYYTKRNHSPEKRPDRWMGACPLCCKRDHSLYFEDQFRPYYRCSRCQLIFVPAPWQLDGKAEKARYDTHENNPTDGGYRNYLGRIIPPLEEALGGNIKHLKGLDYGCGPGPALAQLLEEKGAHMSLFDPYYKNDEETLERTYDFITCTEVFEHMSRPGWEFVKLHSLLNGRAVLAIMTQLVTVNTDFKSWYYKNDETHICYFSRETFIWLGNSRRIQVDFIGRDIIIMKI
jgi:hypothetical protein